jgi:archaellum component FlaG (FlaF/FlaG flagellin family)
MADGGASSFIMLVTALLVSGSVSTILINEWNKVARAVESDERKSSGALGVSVDFAGDPMMVGFEDPAVGDDEMTVYVLNSGIHEMSTTFELLINGVTPATITTSISPSGTDWLPGYLLEITASDNALTYTDGDDASLFFVGISESVQGYQHSATMNKEVRLHEI